MVTRSKLLSRLVLLVVLVLLAFVAPFALAQAVETPPAPDPIGGIVAAVVAVLALVGTFVARWQQTNASLPWYVRLSRVLDATQIVDSTRQLGDE